MANKEVIAEEYDRRANRPPCGNDIGHDYGVRICRLLVAPCLRVGICPIHEKSQTTLGGLDFRSGKNDNIS